MAQSACNENECVSERGGERDRERDKERGGRERGEGEREEGDGTENNSTFRHEGEVKIISLDQP